MAGTDVRVRVRPGVIRVRIAEAGIRPVISVTTPQAQLPISPFYLPVRVAFAAVVGPIEGPQRAGFFRFTGFGISMNFPKQIYGSGIHILRTPFR